MVTRFTTQIQYITCEAEVVVSVLSQMCSLYESQNSDDQSYID